MTMAKNTPMAEFKPIKDKNGRDISPAFIRRALKKAVQPEQRRRTWNTIKRNIGKLPGRQRDGYSQQVDAIFEIGLVLMWVSNLATGYAFVSLMELAALTNTKTVKGEYVGLGRVYRALKMLRAMGYVEYERPLLNPQGGGRDRCHIKIKPDLYELYGTSKRSAMTQMQSVLILETAKQKKAAERLQGLPPETLDALATPETAKILIGWWQWYRYTKATFRRFFINVRRAGLHILPPADSPI